MILTGLLGIAIIGLVVSWEKQLPRRDERFRELSVKRRVLTVAVFPVAGFVAAVCVAALVTMDHEEDRGSGFGLVILLVVGLVVGLVYLLLFALRGLLSRKRPR